MPVLEVRALLSHVLSPSAEYFQSCFYSLLFIHVFPSWSLCSLTLTCRNCICLLPLSLPRAAPLPTFPFPSSCPTGLLPRQVRWGETSPRECRGTHGNTMSHQNELQVYLNDSHSQMPSVFLQRMRKQVTSFMWLLYTDSEISQWIRW